MRQGLLFYVVGASGVGKDTLLAGAMERLAAGGRYRQVRRVITRPAGPGEDHEPVSQDAFETRAAQGGFMHRWEAHGLSYGLPADLLADLARGIHVVANGSRASLPDMKGAAELFVIEITAPRDVLRDRILQRGREDAAQTQRRLERSVASFPPGIDVAVVVNDGTVEEGVAKLVATMEAARLRPAP